MMSEVDEVAQAIKEQFPEHFPITDRQKAISIAAGQMPEESFAMIQAVGEALLELSNE